MWDAWKLVTNTADPFLDSLRAGADDNFLRSNGKPMRESIGTMMQRNIYHYWFHTGEAHAVRQQLGHEDLPQFVGDMTGAEWRAV